MSTVETLIQTRIRQDVLSMHAYAVQDSTGMVKLDAMENPHRLSPALQAELGRRLGTVSINRYPGARVDDLKIALARHVGLPPGCALMLGNGSDELISLIAMACDLPGATIVAPVPGFVMYAMSAALQGLRFTGVPLRPDFSLDDAALCEVIATQRPAITYVAYPNNPTANLWDEAAVQRVIDACAAVGGLVVIDEAYQPFSSRSWIDRIGREPHVLLMRTLSKFGLAGVRLGYLIGPEPLVREIDKLRPPYNVSVLNAECALFALEHADEFAAQAADIRAQRAWLQSALRAMPGVTPYPSDANMLLVRVAGRDAADQDAAARVFTGMRSRGVLVKNVSTMHPLLANCLRLTVGTADENVRMIEALQASL